MFIVACDDLGDFFCVSVSDSARLWPGLNRFCLLLPHLGQINDPHLGDLDISG